MMKQARTLLSSKSLLEKKVRASTLRGFATWSDSSDPTIGFSGKDAAKPTGRVLPYAIFKGGAALCLEPVILDFTTIDSGNRVIGGRGSVMMTFLPAIGERKYDWGKQQMFALSTTEVGSLISMGSKDTSEFFNDPSMESSNSGQVRKSLSITRAGVNNSVLKTNDRFEVPVTTDEFAEMKTAFSFALPHLMSWDPVTGQFGTEEQICKAGTVQQRLTALIFELECDIGTK